MNNKTLKPFGLGFQYPTGEEIKGLIAASNYTGSQIADLLGVNSRRIREWQSGTKRIDYSEWRLLCGLLGLVEINKIPAGPKALVFIFIENGQLKASSEESEILPGAQILGQSTISVPFNIDDKQSYLNDLLVEIAGNDDPLKAFGILGKQKFETAGCLARVYNISINPDL